MAWTCRAVRAWTYSATSYFPFDVVTLIRLRDEHGEPTGQVEIAGLRQCGM